MENVIIGKHSYGELNIISFNWNNKLKIGNYVSIAEHVTFIIDADHYTNHISTYPFRAKITDIGTNEAISKGDILIDDDVWIGYGATILSGVHIGQGAIIAACAVVTKDIPSYAIVGGCPAKIIKYRFSEHLIDKLLNLDFSQLSDDLVRSHIDELYEVYSGEKSLDWFPHRQETSVCKS